MVLHNAPSDTAGSPGRGATPHVAGRDRDAAALVREKICRSGPDPRWHVAWGRTAIIRKSGCAVVEIDGCQPHAHAVMNCSSWRKIKTNRNIALTYINGSDPSA